MATVADRLAKLGSAEEAPRKPAGPQRLVALDAYRGLIMIVLAGGGFGIGSTVRNIMAAAEKGARNVPAVDPAVLERLSYHFSHPEWISQAGHFEGSFWDIFGVIGCSAWDMIQPSFMFMVGVAMTYSYAKREARGDSRLKTWFHVITRSAVLVLLGVLLSSNWASQTNWTFANVLCQIGLGYAFVYPLWNRSFGAQLLAGALILVGYWLAFFLYPTPGPNYDYAALGLDQGVVPGLFEHWNKDANIAAEIDHWFLNLFPRSERFTGNPGGYATLNFIPSIFTMLLGVMAGGLLRGRRRPMAKFALLVLGGLFCIALGAGAGLTICPVIKRIWTPSWTLLAGGWTLWILAAFYLVVDCARLRFWTWPLVVVGTNSMAVYMMWQLMKSWIVKTLEIHFGLDLVPAPVLERLSAWSGVPLGHDSLYAPMVQATMTLLVIWLICVWLYRQKMFIRI
jgi:predicted acyltransferase